MASGEVKIPERVSPSKKKSGSVHEHTNTMDGSIKRLDDESSRFMQCTVRIASLHSAVEEVILNSLAAHCRRVDVLVDLERHSFEVVDDGEGISAMAMRDVVGRWPSAEVRTGSTAQWRSKALPALRHLGSVHIASKCSLSGFSCYKHMSRAEEIVRNVRSEQDLRGDNGVVQRMMDCVLQIKQGTLVMVDDLFGNLPVRRRAARMEAEIAALKAFVRHMSVLHHAVSWTLSLGTLTQSRTISAPAPVLVLPGQSAVAKRVLQLHGADCVQNMQEVTCTYKEFTLTGLLSPPQPECCSERADCQYAFLDGKWLRGCDLLSAELNSAYAELLSSTLAGGRGGMIARHAPDSSGAASERRLLPRFVLHVSCGASPCEVLDEPGKTVVVLSDRESFRAAVQKLVHQMRMDHPPQAQLSSSVRGDPPPCGECEGSLKAQWNTDKAAHYQLAGGVGYVEDNLRDPDNLHRAALSPPSLFRSAFFSGSSTPRAADKHAVQPSVLASPIRRGCWAESPYCDAPSPARTDVYASHAAAASAEDMVTSAVLPRTDPRDELPRAWKRQRLAFDEDCRSLSFTPTGACEDFPLGADSPITSCLPEEQWEGATETGTLAAAAVHEPDEGLHRAHQRPAAPGLHIRLPAEDALSSPADKSAKRAATQQTASITKTDLSGHLRCFGQLHREFILASSCTCEQSGRATGRNLCPACGDTSLLLLFDQHAVDERIRVEALTRQLEWELSEGTVPTCAPADPATLSMTDEEVSALIARSAVVRRWRFDFHIPSGPGVRLAGAEVILRSVPTILGEDLSAADFLEFVRLIAQRGASAPELLLIPPAAQRILSSKACRGAVKFGDALAQELCAGMLDRLFRETQLPFQCAHGRPTVSSIFKMDSVRAWKMRSLAADSL